MAQLGFAFVAEPEADRGPGPPREHLGTPSEEQLDWVARLRPERADSSPVDELRPSIRGQVQLERSVRERLGPRVLVTLTGNRSTMISFRRRGQALYIRVHSMFTRADDEVIDALCDFISKESIASEKAALLDAFIESHRPHLTKARVRSVRPQPVGEVHDLLDIYTRLNAQYFGGKVGAQITWSRAPKKKRRTSMNMGTYSDELRLIRIHPALDQTWVPRYFIESVVYHEMLHQIHDVQEGTGRRCIHTAAFRRDEQKFAKYEEAQKWERKNLRRLLAY